jgi:pimeloyl-ACP methyl ester carboxylesterase
MTSAVLSPTPTAPQQTDTPFTPESGIGGTVKEFTWTWENQELTIVYETLGYGSPVLLVPGLSMVSTRSEMRDLAGYLARRFQVITFDWPGFGDSDRPNLDYTPQLYRQCLKDLLLHLGGQPIAAIAPGHASAYVLQLVQDCPELWSKVVAVVPTWKSPFTNAGLRNVLGGFVRQAVKMPLLGSIAYSLHSTSGFLRVRHAQQAYVKQEHLQTDFLQQKRRTTQKSGARHAAISFVTGGLDPVRNSKEFCALFEEPKKEILVIRGEQVPREMQEEMETIEALPHIESQTLPGSLALHEEFPAELAKAVTPFLSPPLLSAVAPAGSEWLGATILGLMLVTASLVAWALNFA